MATTFIASSVLLLALTAASALAAAYQDQRYQCPHLSMDNCTANDGLAFYDGCKTISCIGWRSAVMEPRQCRPPNGPMEQDRCRVLSRRLDTMQSGAAGGSADSRVNCPQFQGVDMCASGDMFYSYSDGCNFHMCDGSGGALERTRYECPDAATSEQLFFCASAFNSVVRSHNSRHACSAQVNNADRICKVMWPGYRFGDTCFRGADFVCGPGGRLLLRPTPGQCPLAEANESAKCRAVASEVSDLLSENRGFTCPELHYAAVCTAERRGFVYNDGCNLVLCDGEESGLTEGRVCKLPFDASQVVGREFCANQVASVRRRMSQSHRYAEPCLTPAEACDGPAIEGRSYFDGCNYCTCLATGRSRCTRRGCMGFYGTRDEFRDYCRTAAHPLP